MKKAYCLCSMVGILVCGIAYAEEQEQLPATDSSLTSQGTIANEGIAGEVLRIDPKDQCLWLDWDNNTEKIVRWTNDTKFSVLETEKPAKPTDIRKGSYVRMEGGTKDGTYWATAIVIWEGASKPVAP